MPNKNLPVTFKETWSQRMMLKMYIYFAFNATYAKKRMIETLDIIKVGLANETEQTKEMLQIFILQSKGQASANDIKKANQQFRDLLKSMGLGVVIILPFSPITLPLIVKLGNKLGVQVLPDSFKNIGNE